MSISSDEVEARRCQCRNVVIQEYGGAINMVAPPYMRRRYPRGVCVDACLALEISWLWQHEIYTIGSCCGHGNYELAYIQVDPREVGNMRALGYIDYSPKGAEETWTFKPKMGKRL